MVDFEIPLSSAIINLINVIVLQFMLVPLVIGMTSTLAGFENSERMKEKGSVVLESFDPPVIGGNLVTYKGFHRWLMIAIRVSVVVAVGVSNVGLGGRSRVRKVVIEGEVFVPGAVPETESNGTQIRERIGRNVICNELTEDGSAHLFRSVIDGNCHRDVAKYVHIEMMFTATEEFKMGLGACRNSTSDGRTVYKCTHAELVCSQDSEKKDSAESCIGVRYSRQGTYAWVCESARFIGESRARLQDCRKIKAKREDIRWWTDWFTRFEMRGVFAVFASAYGIRQQRSIEVEDGEEEVTTVTLLWIVPVAWIVLLMVVSGAWIGWQKSRKAVAIAHDERSLFHMLDRDLIVTKGNECVVLFS